MVSVNSPAKAMKMGDLAMEDGGHCTGIEAAALVEELWDFCREEWPGGATSKVFETVRGSGFMRGVWGLPLNDYNMGPSILF